MKSSRPASRKRSSRSAPALRLSEARSMTPSSQSLSKCAAQWSLPTATASVRSPAESRLRDQGRRDRVRRHLPPLPVHWNQCARFMDGFKIDQRHAIAAQLVEDFKADGIIYEKHEVLRVLELRRFLQTTSSRTKSTFLAAPSRRSIPSAQSDSFVHVSRRSSNPWRSSPIQGGSNDVR